MDDLPSTEVTGLLLCRSGAERFAFLASAVSRIEIVNGSKFLRATEGDGVGVDAVEVFSEAVSLLPAPRLMASGVGGSLYGFVRIAEALYPVLRVNEYARFLAGRTQVDG